MYIVDYSPVNIPSPPPFRTNSGPKVQNFTPRIQKRTSLSIPLEPQFCYLHSNYERIIFLPSFSLKNDKKVTIKKGNYDRVVKMSKTRQLVKSPNTKLSKSSSKTCWKS